MKNNYQTDLVTKETCKWLSKGARSGQYTGPKPELNHGLIPLLSRELALTEVNLQSTAMWFKQEQILRKVLIKIDKAGIVVWAVKGYDLSRSVYPFPGGRPMCDADLFIQEKDRQKALSVFLDDGWTRVSPGDGVFTSGIVSEMKMLKQGLMAELHTHIFYFPATFPGKLPYDLFTDGRLLEPGLMGFAWHNALLLVIIHLLTNTSIRAVWWIDIYLLCNKITESDGWEKFLVNAKSTNLCNSIALPLATSMNDLGALVPKWVIKTLREQSSGRDKILTELKKGKKIPTLLNIKHLTGWKKLSWSFALFWLILSGKNPLKKE